MEDSSFSPKENENENENEKEIQETNANTTIESPKSEVITKSLSPITKNTFSLSGKTIDL